MAQIGNTTVLPSMTLGVPLAQASGGTGGNYPVYQLILGTAQNTTSGTSIDLTGIPSWAKRITIMFNGVSTNGTSAVLLQLGSSSGGIETSNYASSRFGAVGTSVFQGSSTQGVYVGGGGGAAIISGSYQLCTMATNSWVYSGVVSEGTNIGSASGGNKYISSTLDRVRLTTANGTDLFDAGSVNIMYEGYA